MHSLLTIISFILFVGSLYLLFRSTCVADDTQRSLEGKNANSYPLYEEQDDKVVFYPRRKYSFLDYALVFSLIFIIMLNLSGLSGLLLLLPAAIEIVYAVLLYFHSFDRIEIDKQGVVHKYDFSHRDLPGIIDKPNGIISISKATLHGKREDVYKYSYFLCCRKERILLFEVYTIFYLDSKAKKLLTTILPKYGISNPCFINEHTDSVI